MQYADSQLTHPDVDSENELASVDSFLLAIVLVLVNWALVVLWLSIPHAQVKPIERSLQVDTHRVVEGG